MKLWGERTHVDKSYGHQSGPPHSTAKSVMPLIIRGGRPERAARTHCLIYPRWPVHTADILFRPLRLVIGAGHTTQGLTWTTLEPLSHPSTSTSHGLWLHNTQTVLTLKKAPVFGPREYEHGSTPGPGSVNVARSQKRKNPSTFSSRLYHLCSGGMHTVLTVVWNQETRQTLVSLKIFIFFPQRLFWFKPDLLLRREEKMHFKSTSLSSSSSPPSSLV